MSTAEVHRRLCAAAGGLSLDDAASPAFSSALDASDSLAKCREQFLIPKHKRAAKEAGAEEEEEEAVYLCGNSLGLQPRRLRGMLNEELDKWAEQGVEGHFSGSRPWATIDELVTPGVAALLGAEQDEVAVMNSLSVDLHILMVAFYRPDARGRHKLMMEHNAFCSDHHVARSQLNLHGLSEEESLVLLRPRDGEDVLRTEDVLSAIEREGDSLALVLLPGVQYITGQLFDMAAISRAAHGVGAVVGFDLAHAVGNVVLRLHEWGPDFAAFCSYKYLNAGPGGIAGVFVHSRHADRSQQSLPRLSGWWGQALSDRFKMDSVWRMKPGAQSFQMSNPCVLAVVAMQASLEVFLEAGGMEVLRRKSELLTGYLELLLRRHLAGAVRITTPADPAQRGCQLSLVLDGASLEQVAGLQGRLLARGFICDVRKPNTMRVSPIPLYNTFTDVRRFVEVLGEVLRLSS